MSARQAYNWHPAVTPKLTQEEMMAEGRRPFQTNGGIVFSSRPGAPQSRFDTQSGIGIGGKIGTDAHDTAWKQFFRPAPAATPAPAAPVNSGVAADESFGGGTTTSAAPAAPPPAADPVITSIQSNQKWMQANGFAFQPPPPTPRAPLYNPTGTNQIPGPNLNADPAQFKSQFVNSGGAANPGYVSAVQQFNQSLYQPADTKPSYYEDPTAPVAPTGWTTTSAPQLDAIRQRYGSSSS
jgi:hypothetical protein